MGITVVNLNPCIDWKYAVPVFVKGGLNRVRRERVDVAGKGVNVAVALKNMGLDPLCTGFNFAENGALLDEKLDGLGVRHDFVWVEGAIRTNIKLYEESTGTMTELNQSGSFVPLQAQKQLSTKSSKADEAHETDILVLSGSRPEGVEPDFLAQLAHSHGGNVFLDTEGEALKIALQTAPLFAIKPNLFELESTFDVKLPTPEKIARFCAEKILPYGVQIICVSLGAEGAVLVTPTASYFSPAIPVAAKGLTGAGDAMVAGLVYALCHDLPQENYLPAAIAAATASVILDGTQMCTRGDFHAQLKNAHHFVRLVL